MYTYICIYIYIIHVLASEIYIQAPLRVLGKSAIPCRTSPKDPAVNGDRLPIL